MREHVNQPSPDKDALTRMTIAQGDRTEIGGIPPFFKTSEVCKALRVAPDWIEKRRRVILKKTGRLLGRRMGRENQYTEREVADLAQIDGSAQ